jgi:hypothetical protein
MRVPAAYLHTWVEGTEKKEDQQQHVLRNEKLHFHRQLEVRASTRLALCARMA